MRYTQEQVDAIAAKLRAMPPIEKPKRQDFSKQEAIKQLAKEITALQKRGYTLVQIAESMRGDGLIVATPTLKSYLQRAKPSKAAPKKLAPLSTPPDPEALSSKPTGSSKSSFQPKPDTKDI